MYEILRNPSTSGAPRAGGAQRGAPQTQPSREPAPTQLQIWLQRPASSSYEAFYDSTRTPGVLGGPGRSWEVLGRHRKA